MGGRPDISRIAPQNLGALQEDEQSLCALQEDEQSAFGEVGQNSLNRCRGALWEVGTKLAYYVVGSNSS